MKIVCVGDSITEGQYCDVAWPDFVDNTVNMGVSNDTTRMILERFPADVQQQFPDVVVMQAGHNDANRWDTDRRLPRVSKQAFEANLTEMIDRCRAFGATPILCTITPTHKGEPYDTDVKAYSRVVRMVAALQDVWVADVRTAFFDAPDPDMLLMDDGVHLTAEGHELYAQCVQKALAPLAVVA